MVKFESYSMGWTRHSKGDPAITFDVCYFSLSYNRYIEVDILFYCVSGFVKLCALGTSKLL